VIRPFGERAFLVELDGWSDARAFAASLSDEPIAGVEAAIPGLSSVLVELADSGVSPDAVHATLVGRLAAPLSPVREGRERTIPVIYGGEHGPDLRSAATACGLSPDELAARHAGTEVRVLFCGFAPGFAYLGELPEALHVPRLSTPRTRTPSGSVAIAGTMTGIYPAELPGGWRVIGRTPLRLFDPRRESPAYLAPGDVVRWEPITVDDWSRRSGPADDW
jgi:KipI family sensor histidine kinase inhibitor